MHRGIEERRARRLLPLFLLVFLLVWTSFIIPDWTLSWTDNIRGLASIVGVAGYLLLSLSFLLSSRWPPLEKWMGGLDQLYHFHHRCGLWGCFLVFLHPIILSLRWGVSEGGGVFWYLLPIHRRLSVNLGSYSLLLLLLLIAITYLKFIPYDKWKISHKIMSLMFVLASLHIILSDHRFSSSSFSYYLLFIPMGVGFFGIVYKQIISEFFIQYPLYKVVETKKLNDNLIEVSLTPKGRRLFFVPGQYVFCRFKADEISGESHPFTLIGSSDKRDFSILVKARGDFTQTVYNNVKPGDTLSLEGPYGKFDYTQAGMSQIWIGGGIGIAPFLAWTRTFRPGQRAFDRIDLFYCTHRKEDALFADEFKQVSEQYPIFRFHLFCTKNNQHLSVQKIRELTGEVKGKKILMCGPKRLTQAFIKEFKALGVEENDILFEDFEFF